MKTPREIEQILATLRNLHIKTSRDAEFASHLDRLLKRDVDGNLLPEARRFTRTGETRGIMVVDGPGGGKSTLVDRSLARHPVLAGTGREAPFYLSGIVPSPATFKCMTLELLERSGYPEVSGRREAWNMWQVLRNRLRMLGVSVLWIDEAHDLFCADRNLILRAIKTLMQGEHAVIVILSGTEQLSEIIRSDPQVKRRFSAIHLPPIASEVDRDLFTSVLEDYCRRADLEPPEEDDIMDRLFHGARYRFGRCVELIVAAIERALEDGAPQVDVQAFAQAWAMQEGCPPDRNIFLVEDWRAITLDGEESPAGVHNRKRRG
ncbi:TniB family NTP-binding protein [Rhodovulum adriaticum]|uniref:TniB protein n=1 Tax=Rhodovulum adriaticum TaxID=35804 RepID=A0A4R2NKY6_RHOAD|nr:TniB family NTP-binding protein [Rhodovulum adriaticum]MBK1636496.1 transposase [Rhodovulum adriaticum]TCP22197.1 TniB protein [Rhodovulum adriaticum]